MRICEYALIIHFPSCLMDLKNLNSNKGRRRPAPGYPEKRDVASGPEGKTQSAERISDSGEGGCGKTR